MNYYFGQFHSITFNHKAYNNISKVDIKAFKYVGACLNRAYLSFEFYH